MYTIPYPDADRYARQGFAHVAFRRAVLDPLARPALAAAARRAGGPAPRCQTLAARHDALRALWHRRLFAMARPGLDWSAAADRTHDGGRDANYAFAVLRNCPPPDYDVPHAPRVRPCNRARVCPYCYGRRVVQAAYRAAEFALYGGVHRSRTLAIPAARLVAVSYAKAVPYDRLGGDGSGGERDAAAALDFAADPAVRRADVAGQRGLLGYATLVTVAPAFSDPEAFEVRRATLMALRHADGPVAASGRSNRRVRVEPSPTREALARLLGLAFAYPAAMLFADAARVVPVLNAGVAGNCRMLSTGGAFRNKGEQDYAPPEPAGPDDD